MYVWVFYLVSPSDLKVRRVRKRDKSTLLEAWGTLAAKEECLCWETFDPDIEPAMAEPKSSGELAVLMTRTLQLWGTLNATKEVMLREHGNAGPEKFCYGYWAARGKVEIDTTTPVILPGPRKPVPALVAEIHNTKVFDAVSAWEATKIAAKGGM